jgi:hypothetical protein
MVGMPLRTLVCCLVLLTTAGVARADALPATVMLVDPDPVIAIADRASGATAAERYRAARRGRWTSKQRLVLLVRLREVSSPDLVDVTASRDGNKIDVAITVRRYSGPLAANEITVPLVEVDLGRLAAGRYDVSVDEVVMDFDDLDRPDLTTNPRAGIGATMQFQVRRR